MKRTSRGFNIFSEFKDSYGNTLIVQESSAAGQVCCWIFVKNRQGNDYEVNVGAGGRIDVPSAHLTKAQARRLIRALTKFAGTSTARWETNK